MKATSGHMIKERTMGVKTGLILLACVLGCSGLSVFRNKCTLFPNPGQNTGTNMHMEANKDCTEGSVEWSYPHGSLVVTFKQNNPSAIFKLCIQEENSYLYFKNIYNEATGAVVPKPAKGSESCVDSANGEVSLRLVAGTGMFYLTVVSYEIRQP